MDKRAVWIAVLLVGGLFTPLIASAEMHPHARNGWTFGFNLGGGSAGLSFADTTSTDREVGGTANIRVGYAVTPSVVIGLEGLVWTREIEGVTWTLSVGGPAVTFYPGEQGFYLRGGIGSGSLDAEAGSVTVSKTGFGILAAAGYEWRLARTLALGPQVDFAWMDVGDELTGNFFAFSAALNWYWGSPR